MGPHQNRGEAETGLELWNLSLAQELALGISNGDKRRMKNYVEKLATKVKQVRLVKCTPWLRIRRKPCDRGE